MVSEAEASATMPDITLLPCLSVLFGVTIDELFSLTDDSRMERIENMLEDVRVLSDSAFSDAERYLREKMQESAARAILPVPSTCLPETGASRRARPLTAAAGKSRG